MAEDGGNRLQRHEEMIQALTRSWTRQGEINARMRSDKMSEPQDDLPWRKDIMSMSLEELSVKVAELQIQSHVVNTALNLIRKRLGELGQRPPESPREA